MGEIAGRLCDSNRNCQGKQLGICSGHTGIFENLIIPRETRNEDLHKKSKTEQNHQMLQHHKATITKLLALKPKCLARDHLLFPSDPWRKFTPPSLQIAKSVMAGGNTERVKKKEKSTPQGLDAQVCDDKAGLVLAHPGFVR